MNNVKTYIGDLNLPPGASLSNEALTHRVEVLGEMVQCLLEYIAEKENIQLGFMAEARTCPGLKFIIYKREKVTDTI